jgi:chemosensory pili system protein ChpA (sensor histidine kinase/response regulator)
MELGVNEYMGKPYQEEELLENIARFVAAGPKPN